MAHAMVEEALSYLPKKYRRHALPALGGVLALGVVIVVLLLAYQTYQDNRNERISTAFWELTKAVDTGERDKGLAAFDTLVADANDDQLSFAAMVMAAGHFADGNLDAAQDLYTEVIENSPHRTIRDTARTRLARVLTEKGEYGNARQALNEAESLSPQVDVVISDILGDISLAEGDLEQAANHYAAALDRLEDLSGAEHLAVLLRTKSAMLFSMSVQGTGT